MKKVLIFLFALVTFAACKKDTEKAEVTPKDPASAIAGKYNLSSFSLENDGETALEYRRLPVTEDGVTVSAIATVEKIADGKVSLVLLLKATGEQDRELDLSEYEVRANGSTYGLYFSGTGDQIGEIKDGRLSYQASATSTDGSSLQILFEAKK
ncbi:hypothetical protein ACFQ4C_10710 [Larkinella insperata]|uniref:Lipocalin-like domain-containing protein n=1 Tax=Larkinella insperata TaxID=332158 RepID=A0ABW3QIC5_9BACT|nr:hypothetical protein [Larkinella insperata]